MTEVASPASLPYAGGLHLWRVDLQIFRQVSEQLIALLSEDEQRRANHFRFSEPRERFAIGRGVLRCLLSQYAGVPARVLAFGLGAAGKPYLTGPAEGQLHFNVAHTEDLMLVLVGRDRGVGIDVEPLRAVDGMETILGLLFEPGDQARIRALPATARAETILTAWTLKEALGKAAGGGLVGALHWARLALDPVTGRPLQTQRCGDGARWYGARVADIGSDYVCAVAMQVDDEWGGTEWDLRHYRLALPDLMPQLGGSPIT